MAAATELAKRFFADNSSTYDPIAKLSTLGLDTLWKRQILKRIPPGSRQIIDQACGTGILTLQIARRIPRCRVIGVDLHEAYIDIARHKAGDLRLNNVEFVSGYAEDIIFELGSIDCITSSYLAKYADLDRLVAPFQVFANLRGVEISRRGERLASTSGPSRRNQMGGGPAPGFRGPPFFPNQGDAADLSNVRPHYSCKQQIKIKRGLRIFKLR